MQGGTESAALLVSKSSHLLRIGDAILNVSIFVAAAFFRGVESALYSILAYVAASKAIDFLLHGIEQDTAIGARLETETRLRSQNPRQGR